MIGETYTTVEGGITVHANFSIEFTFLCNKHNTKNEPLIVIIDTVIQVNAVFLFKSLKYRTLTGSFSSSDQSIFGEA